MRAHQHLLIAALGTHERLHTLCDGWCRCVDDLGFALCLCPNQHQYRYCRLLLLLSLLSVLVMFVAIACGVVFLYIYMLLHNAFMSQGTSVVGFGSTA